MFYINYEECKWDFLINPFYNCPRFYINYEECKSYKQKNIFIMIPSFILTMRNVNDSDITVQLPDEYVLY